MCPLRVCDVKTNTMLTTFLLLVIVLSNGSVHALGATEGDLHLVDGITNTSGRVEIYHNGNWGTICDNNFGDEEARVVCTQLGYRNTRPRVWRSSPPGRGDILLDEVQCTSSDSMLTQCRHRTWGQHNCRHSEDVGVECDGQSYVDNMRLAGGTTRSGRLEVNYAGRWGSICAYNFDQSDAIVACRALGLDTTAPIVTRIYGNGVGDQVVEDVTCRGNESALSECGFDGPFIDTCDLGDVGVHCLEFDEAAVANMQIRLNGGSDVSGRLEVSLVGIWGSVCNDGFDNNAAKVACRMLRLPTEHAIAYKFELTGQTLESSEIWLDDVHCNGTEQSLMDCGHRNITQHDCRHNEDIGIFCTADIHADHHHELRLAGTNSTEKRGRIEVQFYGIWGTVCDDYWQDSRNNEVVCRSLHLTFLNANRTSIRDYGIGTGPIWMDNVECSGDEQSLFDCQHALLGEQSCDHSEDVAINCEW